MLQARVLSTTFTLISSSFHLYSHLSSTFRGHTIMINDSIYTFMLTGIGCSSRYLRLATRDIFRVTCNKLVIGGALGRPHEIRAIYSARIAKGRTSTWRTYHWLGCTLPNWHYVRFNINALRKPTFGCNSLPYFPVYLLHGSTSHFSLCTFTHI